MKIGKLCKVATLILGMASNNVYGMKNIEGNNYVYNINRAESEANQNIFRVDLYFGDQDVKNCRLVDTRMLQEMHTGHAVVSGDNIGCLCICYSMDNCLRIFAHPWFRFRVNELVVINVLSFEEVFFSNNFARNIKVLINAPKSCVNLWYNVGKASIGVVAEHCDIGTDNTDVVVYDNTQINQVVANDNRRVIVCNTISGTFSSATEFLSANPVLNDYRDVRISNIISFPNADSITLYFPYFDSKAVLLTKPRVPVIIKGKVEEI